MKVCQKCSQEFSRKIIIAGKLRNLQNRKLCFTCSPFGSHNTRITKQANYNCIECKKSCGPRRRVCSSCSTTKARQKKKLKAVTYRGGKCIRCGYNKCVRSLSFHHTNPSTKFANPSSMYGMSWEKIKTEIDSCDLLCLNCHGEIEEEIYNNKKF